MNSAEWSLLAWVVGAIVGPIAAVRSWTHWRRRRAAGAEPRPPRARRPVDDDAGD